MKEIDDLLRRQIKERGPISVARFMEIVLYCPNLGYYERRPDVIGSGGDFYTAPALGPIFGQLLAHQFSAWLLASGSESLHLIEAGAHDGTLAGTILDWLGKKRPATFDRLTYWVVEPSPERRSWQQRNLEPFAPKVRWVESIARLPDRNVGDAYDIVFSNELLDAFPVHRVQWNTATMGWSECGVTLEGDRFAFTPLPEPTIDIAAELSQAGFVIPRALAEVLPDGYVIDLSPAAAEWWQQAASVLLSGKLMTIDYGATAAELLIPERTQGTLRGFFRQRISDDLLANRGEQDLTAHVNFTPLQRVGEGAGLETDFPPGAGISGEGWLWTQEEFFGSIIKDIGVERWSASDIRQFQQLTHPDKMGRLFRLLLQSKISPRS